MAKMYRTDAFKGPLMRISYAWQLFKLREEAGRRSTYGCTLILPTTGDWSILQKAITEVVTGQWGAKGPEKWKAGLIKNPILDGDGKSARHKETGELHAGMGPDVKFIRATSGADRKPAVFDARTLPLLDEDGCPSGSWGYPVLNAYSWNNPENGDGISFGIEMFQVVKVATGDDILGGSGGARDPSKFFEQITTDDEGEKPGSAAALFD